MTMHSWAGFLESMGCCKYLVTRDPGLFTDDMTWTTNRALSSTSRRTASRARDPCAPMGQRPGQLQDPCVEPFGSNILSEWSVPLPLPSPSIPTTADLSRSQQVSEEGRDISTAPPPPDHLYQRDVHPGDRSLQLEAHQRLGLNAQLLHHQRERRRVGGVQHVPVNDGTPQGDRTVPAARAGSAVRRLRGGRPAVHRVRPRPSHRPESGKHQPRVGRR